MNSSEASSRRLSPLVMWTPALLLLAPVVVFLRHHAYVLYRPEALLILLLFGGAGALIASLTRWRPALAGTFTAACLILAADIQFTFEPPVEGVGKTAVLALALPLLAVALSWATPRVISLIGLMAATAIATTVVLPGGRLSSDVQRDVEPTNAAPLVLHLILDEHIGFAGLVAAGYPDAAGSLRAFLERHRFQYFDMAYAESGETVQSIGHTLDLRWGSPDPELVPPAPLPFAARLVRSRYLTGLGEAGYSIRIYQPDHLDMCESAERVAACHTYASTKLGVLQRTSLGAVDRALVLAGAYLMRSDIWAEVREAYNRVQSRYPASLPSWNWEQTRVSTIAAMAEFDRLERDLSQAARGQVVLAHLLFPHFPYAYDSGCAIKPPLQWLERNDTRFYPHRNTPRGRAARYEKYVQQLACAQVRLERLLAAIPADVRDDAIVVVHGDHGSRIAIGGGTAPTDALDSYSTLFAVRAPGITPGRDGRRAPIACLLAEFTEGGFQDSLRADACRIPSTVLGE